MLRASTFLAAQLLALLSSTTALAQSDPQVPKEADRAAQAMVTRFVDNSLMEYFGLPEKLP